MSTSTCGCNQADGPKSAVSTHRETAVRKVFDRFWPRGVMFPPYATWLAGTSRSRAYERVAPLIALELERGGPETMGESEIDYGAVSSTFTLGFLAILRGLFGCSGCKDHGREGVGNCEGEFGAEIKCYGDPCHAEAGCEVNECVWAQQLSDCSCNIEGGCYAEFEQTSGPR